MWVFIQVLVNDNLKNLLTDKDGWRLKPDLTEVWERIFMDYTERINDPSTQRTFLIIKSIRILSNQIAIARSSIELLVKVDDIDDFKPTIDVLKSTVGYYGQFTKETIGLDLKQCVSRVKLMVTRYNEALSERLCPRYY